ncbi:MAG: recombination protein RecR [Chitinophagaceae bacterium]|nr:recombination protein RecR [Chitinophagaceae bacterium]
MIFSSSYIEEAVKEFSHLPGIGKKTALRLVLHLLKQDVNKVAHFSDTISKMRNNIQYCKTCFNVSDNDICNICSNPFRQKNTVCVVENIRDVMAIEATQQYNGVYHILGELISPLDGIGPEKLTIDALLERLKSEAIDELIMALNPTIEGDTTVFYISKKIPSHIKITTLSRGISFGGELEYADELTLAKSLFNRIPINSFDDSLNE